MFDLTRPMTLENLQQWVDIVRKSDESLPVLFLGTKIDLENDVMVDDDYALQFKDKFKLFDYMKVSSKTGFNVMESFELITKKILERQTY